MGREKEIEKDKFLATSMIIITTTTVIEQGGESVTKDRAPLHVPSSSLPALRVRGPCVRELTLVCLKVSGYTFVLVCLMQRGFYCIASSARLFNLAWRGVVGKTSFLY